MQLAGVAEIGFNPNSQSISQEVTEATANRPFHSRMGRTATARSATSNELSLCSLRYLLFISFGFRLQLLILQRHAAGMKSLTEQLWFEVPGRRGFVNITETVEKLVRKSGVQEGLCLVNAMHITASVFINDAESGLLHDYEVWLEKLAPHAPTTNYQHNRTGEDNADAHMKRQIMGREVVMAITKGKLDFGPWEQIFYGEFDGNRRKRVLVKIIGE
jgi:secondary thiamine-phosphate synthase enzyme